MTVGQLLAGADSMELTGWQGYLAALAEEKKESKDGRRIQWAQPADD